MGSSGINAAVAMGPAGVTSHVRGLKDPIDVGADDEEIFDDETLGRRLSEDCRQWDGDKTRCENNALCKWKPRKQKCKKDKNKRRLSEDCRQWDGDKTRCENNALCKWKPRKQKCKKDKNTRRLGGLDDMEPED